MMGYLLVDELKEQVRTRVRAGAESRGRTDEVTRWLLAGDPAIRWQTLRDLTGAAERTFERARRDVAQRGWGARLLAKQDPEGTWASRLYTPKWISTTYTMLELRDFGLETSDPRARKACALLLDGGLQRDGGINYGWRGGSETCVTGMVLSLLSYFEVDDDRLDTVVSHLLERQMADGGWNCRLPRGATHASVHTTINVLEGLQLYELRGRRHARAVRTAGRRGRRFLLVHRLFRSHRTGNIMKPEFARLHFPPRWHYDILRALDHFQAVGASRDERLAESIEIVRSARRPDGRWALRHRHKGKTHFELERLGRPSRWNTLRAMRVLRWWDR